MKLTQKDKNPFVYSDSNKRYHTYDYYIKHKFGKKCAKIPLDCGFTCPNIDGTAGYGGCIYCSDRGSGDFAAESSLSVKEQIDKTRTVMEHKWNNCGIIPYFQAHTNTYAPLDVLKEKYEEALSYPDVVGLNIATRADALPDDVCEYLGEIAERTVLTVELGLQSIHDSTAKLINRCHTTDDFLKGYQKLRKTSDKINICVHIINGLPYETCDMMIQTAEYVASLAPEFVKIHSLHVLKGTPLEKMYADGKFNMLTMQEYVDVTVCQIERLPKETVIARVTGDGDKNALVAPLWSIKKTCVINEIDKELYKRDSYQGKLLK